MRIVVILLVSALACGPAWAQDADAPPSDPIMVAAHPLGARGVALALGPDRAAVRAVGPAGALRLMCGRDDGPAFVVLDREPRDSERAYCAEAGFDDLAAFAIGHGGVALAIAEDADPIALTRAQIYRALAAATPDPDADCAAVPNDRLRWSDIDVALPDRFIAVIAPPLDASARAGLALLAMESAARDIACVDALRLTERTRYRALAQTFRTGEGWIDGAPDVAAMVRLLEGAPGAIAAFDLPFAFAPNEGLRLVSVDGTEPSRARVRDGDYPLARPLTIYVDPNRIAADEAVRDAVRALACGSNADALREGGVLPAPVGRGADICAED